MAAETLFDNIDYTALRTQKNLLLSLSETLPDRYDRETIDGLIHLIDGLQDYAVDVLGIPEIHVFDFEAEEGRE